MVDEGLHSLYDAQNLIEHEACDIFNLKLQKIGGLTFCKRLTVMAESANIACFMGSEGETGIDTAAALHLVASTPNFKYCADLCGPYMYQDDVVKQPFSVKDGCLEVPTRPGLGVELDEQKVEKYTIKQKT
jgi:muconate cycloisomerase